VTLDRRQFLRRSGLGAAGALAGVVSAPTLAGADDAVSGALSGPDARLPAVPFHGAHQAGILTSPPPAAAFVAFDVIAPDRPQLAELLRTVTSRARFLTAGGRPPDLGSGSPPSDSGTLGAQIPPDGLTVTLGVGSTLFDDRYGLSALRPVHLVAMRAFPNDDLNPAPLNGNLNMGHAFNCFQQDVRRQFEAVQGRLVNEALDDYVSPFGGGYFFALPGVRNSRDWLGRSLMEA